MSSLVADECEAPGLQVTAPTEFTETVFAVRMFCARLVSELTIVVIASFFE